MKKAYLIKVKGLVQGVGFRPDVARLARKYGLGGYVKNVSGGSVEIWVEGIQVENFLDDLKKLPPPIEIEQLDVIEASPKGFEDFRILPSGGAGKRSQVPPDFAICENCLKEILNPFSRRFRYALNSCAKCGPRFSMIKMLPYDRENTSMAPYPLCPECEREYSSIEDRRYHAQGISCNRCGPRVTLRDSDGKTVLVRDPITEAAKLLEEGFILAIKGMGGYHLAAKATSDEVVLELRKRKNRPRKPFALMALNYEVALGIVKDLDRDLFSSPEAPIILAPKREGAVSEWVAPGHELIGVMRAYTGLHYLLLMQTKEKFSIMTSANPTGKPTCIDLKCVLEMGVADYVLDHDREIVHRVDDSVIRRTGNSYVFLRRSRGYAPRWIEVRWRLPEALAVGAELQNVGAVSFENKVVMTQYIGDTDELENLEFLEKELRWFVEQYSVEPSFVVVDKHPLYNSRKLGLTIAEEMGSEVVEVQHHHAHVNSVMADLGLEEAVGIAIDGTGYGEDGAIWGGEVIYSNLRGFERLCHLRYYKLPGGDRAVKYPARIAISILHELGELDRFSEELSEALPGKELEFELTLKTLNSSPNSSSLGRLLDAASVLLGISKVRTYEGEPAMLLEATSFGGKPLFKEDFVKGNLIDGHELILRALMELERGARIKDVAYTIQFNLGYNFALCIRDMELPKVISGGAAVNQPFYEGVKDVLKEVFLPKRVPPGDGGISLGQLVTLRE
ncbi:carbamoyltransferase HypF [Ignicoccus islandicus]|nr:carbamoyltransferase HypF [Ignicoccus islandicus]